MKATRIDWDGADAGAVAAELRALPPSLSEVSEEVAAIIAAVESEGDAALMRLERELGGVEPTSIRVGASELAAAQAEVDPAVLDALATAAENIEAVAALDRGARTGLSNELESVTVAEVPLGSAGAYVPGGRAAYPSTALMCGVPARVAGVGRIAFASPARPDGRVSPLVLAAADLIGTSEVYAIGGAQAIAALALGTESIPRVDVIAGPGNRYVQEAKRQLVGRVSIDGIAGPSELMVIADGAVEARQLALDLCAQAEHGDDGLLVACAPEASLLEEIERLVAELAEQRPSVKDAPLALVTTPTTGAAVELANALAPEHLQLACADADDLVDAVRTAGCVFVGPTGATAFGDYAAGSNHVLPTGGAGRFQGPLGPATFRRRLATVRITEQGAAELAPVVATLAEAEGFPVHGESALARAAEPEGNPPGNNPPGNHIGEHHMTATRTAEIERSTKETKISLKLNLDGGEAAISTGVGFLDHMLELLARHGRLGLVVEASGDLETGAHHTTEDVGIVLGQAIDEALGDRAGIRRYGFATIPMDEALAECAIDISGRPMTVYEADLPDVAIADFDTELTEEFFRAVANNSKLTLHIRVLCGSNAHHMVEAAFKAFARALRQAVSIDPEEPGVPSTKGTLTS